MASRKIGLSRKKAHWTKPEGEREEGAPSRRVGWRAIQGDERTQGRAWAAAGPLFSMGGPDAFR